MVLTATVTILILGYMWVAVPLFGGAHRASTPLILAILGLCAWGNARSGAGFKANGLWF